MGKQNGFWHYFKYLILVISIFTVIDTFVHATIEYLEVYYYPIPAVFSFISLDPLIWYAIGKFVGSIILGAILYLGIKKVKKYWLAILIFSLTITTILEVRYILSGYYSELWHLYNFLQHTTVLYITA